VILKDRPAAQKLLNILEKQSIRAGEFAVPFSRATVPLAVRNMYTDFSRYELEVGCGWGEYTRSVAVKNPQTLYVALEKKLARILSSSRSQKTMHIKNIRYLALDVSWFFENIFTSGTFDAVTINFPDPWPKLRHHKHRFVTPVFATEIFRITRPGAMFTFASDDYRYARECAETFEKSNLWQNILEPYAAAPHIHGRPETFFEKLHRDEGATIYFLRYKRMENTQIASA